MHEIVREFLETQKNIERRIYEEEKAKTLINLGIYEKEYEPATGFGHTENDNRKFKFNIQKNNIKIGDKLNIPSNGETIQVIIDKIESGDDYINFPYWDDDTLRRYKKVPIEVTDDEYEEILKHANKSTYNTTDYDSFFTKENTIAKIFTVIGWIVYIAGIIAGFSMIGGFGSGGFFGCAIGAFISGTTFLGFAEIIELLEDIKNK